MSAQQHLPTRFSIPERAARLLSTVRPAVAGSGGHDATFAAAHVVANGFALDEETSLALLFAHYNPRCLPPWTAAELRHKVRDALANPGPRGRGYLLNAGETQPAVVTAAPPARKYPVPDAARVAAVVRDGPTALQLWARSPVLLDVDDGSNCESIVKSLFADADNPDGLLCIGKSSCEFATRPLATWLASGRLAEFSFIVPAHMTRQRGMTKTGKESEHCLDNTGLRRFVVVEFDRGVTDEHAALLWHLDGYAPLALVVHSGGKSLHGWFPVAGQQSEGVRAFMRYAASLGADPALFRNHSQFVRLPAGTREGGCRQSVFYFAPSTLAATAKPKERHGHE